MGKRAIREDHISHERWMVSYADFMTLLLAFFVVMYSVSQLNEDKYRVLTRTLEKAFNVPESSINPIQVGDPVRALDPGVVEDAIESPEQLPGSGRVDEPEPKATTSEPQLPEEFRRISQQVEQQFAELVRRDLLSVQGNEEWLEIELKSSLLFESGVAELNREAGPIIAALADIVRGGELPIRVEGFTDDRPIASTAFPSNWELSSARAASVVKLLSDHGVSASRLAAVGYGEFQPKVPNTSEEGRAANRRVVLMISRTARLRPQLVAPLAASPAPPVEPPATAAEPLAGTQALPAAPDVPAAQPAGGAVPPMVRVELEGGGVLFTSDPERARLLQQQGPADANAVSPEGQAPPR